MTEDSPQQLLPRRNPGLIQRIARAVFNNDPGTGPQPSQQTSTQSGATSTVSPTALGGLDQYFNTSVDRQAVYSDVDEMDQLSEEASVALDTIADNSCSSEDGTMQSFEVHSEDDRVQGVLDRVVATSDLHHKVYSMARNAVKYGDFVAEVIVNGEGDVVDVRQLPPKTLWRNEDGNGNLKMGRPRYDAGGRCLNEKGECAFEQRDPDNQSIIAAFFPWQIIHGRWNWDGFSQYGRSYLRVSRIIWKKLHAEEEALIMGRLVRAMLKLAFYIDTTGQSRQQKEKTLSEFQENILKKTTLDGKREKPFSVLTDFFLAVEHIRYGGQTVESKTRIESIDPKNSGLTEIDDVKHFHRKFLATLRVPPAYMGFEEHAGGKTFVSMQDIQFIRFLRRLQQFMGQCLRQAFDTALVLADVDPRSVEYEIKWPPLSTADEAAAADAFYKQSQGWALLLGTNSLNQTPVIDPVYIQKHGLEMSDADIEEMNQRMDEQEQAALDKLAKQEDIKKQTQIDLLKEKMKGDEAARAANPGPVPHAIPEGTNDPQVHDHSQRTDPARVASGANTALRQELVLIADAVEDRVAKMLDPEFARLTQEAADAVAVAMNGNGKHGR